MTRRAVPSLVTVLATLLGCGGDGPPPTPRHAVSFLAESDPGVPLAGVTVKANGELLGESDGSGTLAAVLDGASGTMVQIEYTCPEGHEEPERPKSLILTSFQALDPEAGPRGLQMRLECPPKERMAALVVRTGQPDLAVLVDGTEVARTDATGVAHHLLRGETGSRYRVEISTEGYPKLRPQNPPASVLTLGSRADAFVVAETIAEPRPPSRRRRRRRPSMSVMRIIRLD